MLTLAQSSMSFQSREKRLEESKDINKCAERVLLGRRNVENLVAAGKRKPRRRIDLGSFQK